MHFPSATDRVGFLRKPAPEGHLTSQADPRPRFFTMPRNSSRRRARRSRMPNWKISWADDGSLDFIDHLGVLPIRADVHACLTVRRSWSGDPAWGEGQTTQMRLTLQPLSKRESRQLVEEILRQFRTIPPEFAIFVGVRKAIRFTRELIRC